MNETLLFFSEMKARSEFLVLIHQDGVDLTPINELEAGITRKCVIEFWRRNNDLGDEMIVPNKREYWIKTRLKIF